MLQTSVSSALYDNLDFTNLNTPVDATLEKFLKDAALDYEKSKAFQDTNIKPPTLDTGYGAYILVTGLPVAPKDKLGSVKALVNAKILSLFNLQANLVDIDIEVDEQTGNTTGKAILAFDSPESARIAQEGIDGLTLAKLTLTAISFDILDDVLGVASELKEASHKQDAELLYFLNDSYQREQLATRTRDTSGKVVTNEVKLFWNNDIEGFLTEEATLNDEKVPDGDFECEKIEWSNSGKYLAVYTNLGIVLYGGKDLETLAYFKHSKVAEIKFSPDDTYMATFAGLSGEKGKPSENMIVWNVRSGVKLKVFSCPKKSVFDLFSWSFDEQFCATIIEAGTKPLLYVYDSQTVDVISEDVKEGDKIVKKKKPINVDNPRNLAWANKRNTLCFVCYPIDPTSTVKPIAGCIDIPSKTTYRWLDLAFKINSSQIKWDDNDRWVSIYMITTYKKDIEHLIQVGVLPKGVKSIGGAMSVINHSFKDKEKSLLKDFIFDQTGKNFAITFEAKSKRTAFEYYSIKYETTIKINKEDHIDHFEFANVIFSNIENLCIFQTKGEIAFVHLKNASELYQLKQTGEIKRLAVGNGVVISYDNTGRNVLIFDKTSQRLTICTAYGHEKLTKDLAMTTDCLWRKIKRVPIEDSVIAQLKKDLTREVAAKMEKDDDMRTDKFKNIHQQEKQEKTDKFMTYFSKHQQRWDATRAERVALFGYDPDVIEDPVYLEFVDKEEEYDVIVLPGK